MNLVFDVNNPVLPFVHIVDKQLLCQLDNYVKNRDLNQEQFPKPEKKEGHSLGILKKWKVLRPFKPLARMMMFFFNGFRYSVHA